MTARVPPHSIEAEQAVLGSMLLEASVVDDVVEVVSAEDFYRSAHQRIYETVTVVYDRERRCDLLLLREALERAGMLAEVGGSPYLMELTEAVPTAANASHYAEIVAKRARTRRIITASARIMSEAYDVPEDVDKLADLAERELLEATQARAVSDGVSIGSLLPALFASIDKPGERGLRTGFGSLDAMTAGLMGGQLIILAARPGMGKTTLALNIARNVAVREGRKVAVYSLEMSRQELGMAIACSAARVNSSRWKRGTMPAEDVARLCEVAEELRDAPLHIDDTPGISIAALRAKARRRKARHGLDLIVIDYLQLMLADGKHDTRQQQISHISRSLKALAGQLGVPIIALAQLSRAVEQRDKKRPRMSDLRESGSLEQDADMVWLLYRREYYWPDKDKGQAELIIDKHRGGETGSVWLTFIGEQARFEDGKVVRV